MTKNVSSNTDKWRFLTANTTADCQLGAKGHTARGNENVRVLGLRVDYVDRPLGLENTRPTFSWRIESDASNFQQSAYRILVATSEPLLAAGRGDLWDSGRVESSDSLGVSYQGEELRSRQRCWWRVQVWDQTGREREPSDISWWEMGLLSADDWTAQWLAVEDATARADRQMPLQWMWSTPADDRGEELRYFRASFTLSAPSCGGVIFTVGRSFEKVTRIWLDGSIVTVMYPGRNLTRENLPIGGLRPGKHLLVVEVRRTNPFPEVWREPRPAGLGLFARFDGEHGQTMRFVSGSEWRTSINPDADGYHTESERGDAKWTAVATSPLDSYALIDPAMYLRRVFSVEKPIANARLYITALGCYEARLNGHRVGDALLTPEISQYDKRVYYRVYDVTQLLRSGANALGLTVGDGWYASHPDRYAWGPAPRRVIAQLECTFVDGTRQVIATGPGWRISRSPIQQAEICHGETYDARLEQPGWDEAGFDDLKWESAEPAQSPPCRLVAHVAPPIRAMEVLKPVAITTPLDGVHVFDFGQSFVGWGRLHVKGKSGTRIDLRYSDRLKPSGEIDQFVLMNGKAVDVYILRGDEHRETFEPHFAYHGFRYIQVTGLGAIPSLDSLEGVVIHSDLEPTSRLETDHPLTARLWRNIVWSQRSNLIGIPTDCNDRAERMAYLGDTAVRWDTTAFNMDVATLTRQQSDHARDRQFVSGVFPPVAPAPTDYALYRAKEPTVTPGWADGSVILPWTNWRRYGDLQIIEQNWEAMDCYLNLIQRQNSDFLWLHGRGPDLGDWLAIGETHFYRRWTQPTTPLDLFATAYWAHSAELLAQMAEASGRLEDAQRIRAVHAQVRSAFIDRYVQADGRVGNGSQTCYVLALKFNLVPAGRRQRAAELLVADIRARGMALSTGIIGTQYILDVLVDAGFAEIAYNLLLREEYPSWGYMIANGATAIWERWDGCIRQNYTCASHNHLSLGSVGGFLFRRMAGIDAAVPGFKRIIVRPILDSRIKRCAAHYDSVMGRISVEWSQALAGSFAMSVSIPANCAAMIHLPAHGTSRIKAGGEDIESQRELWNMQRSEGEAVVTVGSGRYEFTVESATSKRCSDPGLERSQKNTMTS